MWDGSGKRVLDSSMVIDIHIYTYIQMQESPCNKSEGIKPALSERAGHSPLHRLTFPGSTLHARSPINTSLTYIAVLKRTPTPALLVPRITSCGGGSGGLAFYASGSSWILRFA